MGWNDRFKVKIASLEVPVNPLSYVPNSFRFYSFGKIFTWLLTIGISYFAFNYWAPVAFAADVTDPVTTHALTGTTGNNGWFKSDIGVTLTATDFESGPDETTYWVDSETPTVVDHNYQAIAPFLNPSFEQGNFFNIQKWYSGLGGLVAYYRSNVSPKDGNFSAAIAFIGSSGSFFHWHNEPHAVFFPAGENVEISAWVRAVMISSDDAAYFEVWGQNSGGTGDQLITTSDILYGFNWSWHKLTASFTVPSGTNYIYIKAGAKASPVAIVYWDFVQTRNVGSGTAQVQFNYSQEGSHTLHYFSTDNSNNVESDKTTALKKDTVIPNPWQNFTSNRTSCAHCYDASAEVRDITSGVDVGTAQYRFYTEHLGQYWSDWIAVESVTRAGTGSPASSGETNFVSLNSPEIDFGDSTTGPFRVQFRISDMAGNLSLGPVYEIAAPWIKAQDGSIYVGGQISIPLPSSGEAHTNADVTSNQSVASFSTSTNWIDGGYSSQYYGSDELSDLIPAYYDIKAKGVGLPSNRLPTSDGIYLVSGDYSIDSSSLAGGYEGANISAIVIIEGDLTISNEFTVIEENNTVFIVEGAVMVDHNVENMAGFFITQGHFDSAGSGQSNRPLTVDGSVIALQGYILPRDLGANGAENNTNTPSEKFVWQADMVTDETLARYLTNQMQHYKWQEIERP